MGKKKYYCEVCDRLFNDDITTRKKHFQSVIHIKLKKEHYDNYRDTKTIIAEESCKKPCRRFLQEGHCSFGNTCIYTHYSKADLKRLEEEEFGKTHPELGDIPSLNFWFQGRTPVPQHKSQINKQYISQWTHELPCEVKNKYFIPPSVEPVRICNLIQSEVSQWGENKDFTNVLTKS